MKSVKSSKIKNMTFKTKSVKYKVDLADWNAQKTVHNVDEAEKHKFVKNSSEKLQQDKRIWKYKAESELSHRLILLNYITRLYCWHCAAIALKKIYF